ncbi:hypothetical protein O181_042562 [Austropuccinia psidii MF-1]|uniref:MAGE domain-containing protein n=1 Tax=Austropuccinia psidii MF-1 TaxID=1389203 RepID=A0A9Q3DN30_9BASI|nr:hypothetical protein [Austropuccinia psidii MF-1]
MEFDRESGNRARELARYALINELKRRPFKRDEVSKAGLLGNQGRSFDKLLRMCNNELSSVFGMELVEMRSRGFNAEEASLQHAVQQASDNSQGHRSSGGGGDVSVHKGPKAKGGSTRQYVLRSRLPSSLINQVGQIVDTEIPEDENNEDEVSQRGCPILDWRHGDELGQLGVLGFILALILIHGRAIDNRQLLTYLKRFKIDEHWKPPLTPASIRPPQNLIALLNQFCKQGYLEYTQQGTKSASAGPSQATLRRQSQIEPSDMNQNTIEWRWGARAEIEFGEKQIAEFMSNIFRSAKRQVAEADTSDSQRPPKASHEKIMQDIKKAAGSKLQDCNSLQMPGATGPADLEVS